MQPNYYIKYFTTLIFARKIELHFHLLLLNLIRSTFQMAAAVVKSTNVLVIGGTGSVGKFIVEASVKAGYPTFALVRESTMFNPAKSSIIQTFKNLGVNLVLVRNIRLFSCINLFWLIYFG